MPGTGNNWQPSPGTPPGRTEFRVLRAMGSLLRAGAPKKLHLGAIYGYATERGYEATNEYDRRWQLAEKLESFGWVRNGWTDRGEEPSGPCFIDPEDTGREIRGYDEVVEYGDLLGIETWWRPDETTVHKRLVNLATRGYVEKVGPALWSLTSAGRELLRKFDTWNAEALS